MPSPQHDWHTVQVLSDFLDEYMLVVERHWQSGDYRCRLVPVDYTDER